MSPELPLIISGENWDSHSCYIEIIPLGPKSQAPCTSSLAAAVVPASQSTSSGDTQGGGNSQHVDSSEPETLDMMEDVAGQQSTLLHSLQQAISSARSEHTNPAYIHAMMYIHLHVIGQVHVHVYM